MFFGIRPVDAQSDEREAAESDGPGILQKKNHMKYASSTLRNMSSKLFRKPTLCVCRGAFGLALPSRSSSTMELLPQRIAI